MSVHLNSENWKTIGDQLKEKYKDKYFTHHRFNKKNFLEPVTPYHTSFFGTKVHTVLILANPRDSDEDGDNDANYDFPWPEDELKESMDKIKESYKVWPYYKVDIWIDYNIALDSSKDAIFEGAGDEDDDNGPHVERMNDFETEIKKICKDMKDYGFEYKGRINELPEADFFFETYEAFYAR